MRTLERSDDGSRPSALRTVSKHHLCTSCKRKQLARLFLNRPHTLGCWSPASSMLSLLVVFVFLAQTSLCFEDLISLREDAPIGIVQNGRPQRPEVVYSLHELSQPIFARDYFAVGMDSGEVRLLRPLPGWHQARSYRLYIVRRDLAQELPCTTVRTLIVSVVKTRNRTPQIFAHDHDNERSALEKLSPRSSRRNALASLTWRGAVYDADCDFVVVNSSVAGVSVTTNRHDSCMTHLNLHASRPWSVLALDVTVDIGDGHHSLRRVLRLRQRPQYAAFAKIEQVHWQMVHRASEGGEHLQLKKPFANATYVLANTRGLLSVGKRSGLLRFRQDVLRHEHNARRIFMVDVVVQGCSKDKLCTKHLLIVVVRQAIPDSKSLLPTSIDRLQPKVSACCRNAALAIMGANATTAAMETVQVDSNGIVRLNSKMAEQETFPMVDMLHVEIMPCKRHPRRVVRSAVQLVGDSSGISIAPFVLTYVPEDKKPRTFLVQVPASVTTVASPGSLLFRISAGNAEKLFTIDERSGNITLAKMLDYEKASHHQLAVTASLGNSLTQRATSHVHINVVEVNEHTPTFVLPAGQSLYTASIAESLKPGQRVLQLTAIDRDAGRSGLLNFSVIRGDKKSVFAANDDGELVLEKALDYELTSRYELVVLVRDNGQPERQSQVNVQITVLNVNDNAPAFIPPTYHASVRENSAAISSILQMSTVDVDYAQPVLYDIVDGNANGKFVVGKSSGVLGVSGALDREAQKEYRLVVRATDNGHPRLTTDATVVIEIEDVNDNPSSSGTQEIVISSYKGIFQAGPVGFVEAGDPDDNDALQCKIMGGHQPTLNFFSVRDDCLVSLLQSDTPAGTYQLDVDVRDGQHPWVKRQVQIKVVNVPSTAPDQSLTFRVRSSPVSLIEPKAQLRLQYALQQTTDTAAQNLYLLDMRSSGVSDVTDVSFAVASGSDTFVQRDRLLVDLSVNRTIFERESGTQLYSLPVDPCASEPCKHLGTCQVLRQVQPSANSTVSAHGVTFHPLHISISYHCICRPGTTGPHCEHAVGACYSSPCQTGSTCQDGPADGYTCLCADSTSGCMRQKPTPANPCRPSPCLNKGMCLVENKKAVCRCRSLFYGALCQYSVLQPADHCQSGPCSALGRCSAGRDNYTCSCPVGYAGSRCQRRTLPTDTACASNPCFHGAVCTPQGSSYTCLCSPGFAGPRCSWSLNACQQEPCQNGATCIRGQFGTYVCDCLSGYAGQNCTIATNPCHSQPCSNGGRCIALPGVASSPTAFSCSCKSPYYGSRCEKSLFPAHCTSNPCSGGATCTAGVDGYSCACPGGRSGDRCELTTSATTQCASNPCLHNSRCIPLSQGTGFRCVCSPGFTGDRCQANINECASEPCFGNSSCHDAVNGYLCKCPPGMHGQLCQWPCPVGYSGSNCLSRLYKCQPGACLNGATCVESANTSTGYECRCPPFYTGSNCDQKLSCADKPCLHGGICQQEGNGYRCACQSGHTGLNCELTAISVKPGGYRLFRSFDLQTTGSIQLRFTTYATNGLMVYATQLQNGSSLDFVAMELSDGYVQAVFGLGGESQIQLAARTRTRLNDGDWHAVKISHTGELGSLEVDGCLVETISLQSSTGCRNSAVAGGPQRNLNLGLPFHLGGVAPSAMLSFPPQSRGFSGCLGEVIVNNALLDLAGQFIEEKTDAGCPAIVNPCSSQSCTTGATCVPLWSGYRCVCPLGKTGNRCEKESSLLSFSGSGYVRYELVGETVGVERQRRAISPMYRSQSSRSTFSDILQMTLRPLYSSSSERQLLWYMGSDSSNEYASLQIVNGTLSYIFNLGDGVAMASLLKAPLYDGKWHTITVERVGRLATIKMDAIWLANATSGGNEWLDVSTTHIYLAGLPTNITTPASGYRGCVRDVRLDTNDVPLTGSNGFAKAFLSATGTSNVCLAGQCQDECHLPWECNSLTGMCECPSGECTARVNSEEGSFFSSLYFLYIICPVAGLLIFSIILLLIRYKRRRQAKVTLKKKAALPPMSPDKTGNNNSRSFVMPNPEPDAVIGYSYEGGGESVGMMYSVEVLVQEANRSTTALNNQIDSTYSQQETAMTSLQTTPAPSSTLSTSTRAGSTSTSGVSFQSSRTGSLANPLDRVLFLERGGISGRSSAQSSHKSSKYSTPASSDAVTPRMKTVARWRSSPQPQRVSPQGASHKATPIPSPRPSRRSSPPGQVSESFSEVTDKKAAQQLHSRLFELNGDRSLATPDQRQLYCDEGSCHLDQFSDSIDSDLQLKHYSKEPARLTDPRRSGPVFERIAELFHYEDDAERTSVTPRPLKENLV